MTYKISKSLFIISKSQQLKELTERVPPILNVDVVIVKKDKILFGRRNKQHKADNEDTYWLFPGGRMKYTESPQETALRIIKTETPGLKCTIRRLITAFSDKGYDHRANGVTLFYLCDYVSGTPRPNKQLDRFVWVDKVSVQKLNNVYELELKMFDEIDAAMRIMHSNEDELLVEVDKNNKEIGSITKRDAHAANKRYHRAAHIMIFTSHGKVVLQQRSLKVIRHPGAWDMPGGHEVIGQTIEQCAYAELAEELGIHTKLALKRIGLKKQEDQVEFYYLYYGVSDGPYGFDRNEVAAIKAFDCNKLLGGAYNNEYEVLSHVMVYTDELRSVWEPLAGNIKNKF